MEGTLYSKGKNGNYLQKEISSEMVKKIKNKWLVL
jgi:hypothetical protein